MPHNWASGEFIRMVRHMLILERGGELHLLEALPKAWTKPGGGYTAVIYSGLQCFGSIMQHWS